MFTMRTAYSYRVSPGGSQPHGLASAIEKFFAVFLLELADLGADGRLGAEQFLARARKAAEFGDLNKSCKLVEIHNVGAKL